MALRITGRIAAGRVWEQQVSIDDEAGQRLVLHLIELQLDMSTEDGDTVIRLLTNLPPKKVAERSSSPSCTQARIYVKSKNSFM